MPKGNKSKTKFSKSQDLRRYFKRRISDAQKKELAALFGSPSRSRRGSKDLGKEPALAGLFKSRTPIRMKYKGKLHKATVRPDGNIVFRGRVFATPSGAAKVVIRRSVNGWSWWRFEARPGEWERLSVLRGRKEAAVALAV